MKIFKFGGASVKDADSVKNVSMVLKAEGICQMLAGNFSNGQDYK